MDNDAVISTPTLPLEEAGALVQAREAGARTATLQASPDGRGVYERLVAEVAAVGLY